MTFTRNHDVPNLYDSLPYNTKGEIFRNVLVDLFRSLKMGTFKASKGMHNIRQKSKKSKNKSNLDLLMKGGCNIV